MSVKLKITETCLCKDKKINKYKFECQPNFCRYLGNKNIAIVFIMKFILNCEHEDTFDNGHL